MCDMEEPYLISAKDGCDGLFPVYCSARWHSYLLPSFAAPNPIPTFDPPVALLNLGAGGAILLPQVTLEPYGLRRFGFLVAFHHQSFDWCTHLLFASAEPCPCRGCLLCRCRRSHALGLLSWVLASDAID